MSQTDKVWTIVELLRWGTSYFADKGIDSPRLSLELLLCKVTGLQRIDLYVQHDKPLAKSELAELREMIRRRVAGEPLQYILGSVDFLGCTIAVSSGVLIPRPETELIVDMVCDRLSRQETTAIRILDIGTGSGCIGIALARRFPDSRVLGLDVSQAALVVAEGNAKANTVENIVFKRCDILQEVPKIQAPFDVIISNPPYIAEAEIAQLQQEVRDHEPLDALTDYSDGMSFYARFAKIFPQLLSKQGFFSLELADGTSSQVSALFSAAGFACEVEQDMRSVPKALFGSHGPK